MLIPIEVTRLVDQERRQDAERRGRWFAIIREQRQLERRQGEGRSGAEHRTRGLRSLFARFGAVAGRLGAAIDRRLSDHTIPQLDASAEALWPANPEEADPPRWQLHLNEPRPRHAVEDVARSRRSGERGAAYRPGRTPRVTE